ncbi:MAG: hypothetical protein U0R50_04780 [Gaiellales bacterium]
MRRVALLSSLVAMGLAVIGLVATCSEAGGPPSKTVLNLGDSLAVGIDPYLESILSDWTVTPAAVSGRRSDEGLAALERRRKRLPRVLVVSLGTNDDPQNVDGFAGVVAEVERLAGRSRCIVWTTVVRPPVGGVDYTAFNDLLRREDQRLRSFRLVDWEAIVAKNPGYLREDGVHAVAEGYRARAEETARVVRRC